MSIELPPLPFSVANCIGAEGNARREWIKQDRAAVLNVVADRLNVEIGLEGFGCACIPGATCDTCRARNVLNKVIGPFIKQLRAAAGGKANG